MPALHHVLDVVFHVVAQVVEAELVVGAVGDVGRVGGAPLGGLQPVHDHADGEPEERVDAAHPFRVALGEVVVDGDDVDAAAGERVQVDGEGGDERLAFAGLHLGDRAFVQDHAADELHVEVPLAERALRRLAHRREGIRQKGLERRAVGDLLAELVGLGAQLRVAQPLVLRLQSVDRVDHGLVALDASVVCRSEDLAAQIAQAKHAPPFRSAMRAPEIARHKSSPFSQACIEDLGRLMPHVNLRPAVDCGTRDR